MPNMSIHHVTSPGITVKVCLHNLANGPVGIGEQLAIVLINDVVDAAIKYWEGYSVDARLDGIFIL